MSDMRCLRCRHFPKDHGPRGGACKFETYTTERRETNDGVEILEDVTMCTCLYLMLGA